MYSLGSQVAMQFLQVSRGRNSLKRTMIFLPPIYCIKKIPNACSSSSGHCETNLTSSLGALGYPQNYIRNAVWHIVTRWPCPWVLLRVSRRWAWICIYASLLWVPFIFHLGGQSLIYDFDILFLNIFIKEPYIVSCISK